MGKKNAENKGMLDMILIDTTRTVRHSKFGKAVVNFSEYQDLQISFVDSNGREKLVLSFSPEIEGTQAQVTVLDSRGDSVSHLAAIFK